MAIWIVNLWFLYRLTQWFQESRLNNNNQQNQQTQQTPAGTGLPPDPSRI